MWQQHFGLNDQTLEGRDNLWRSFPAYFLQFFDHKKEQGLTDLYRSRVVSIACRLLPNFKVI